MKAIETALKGCFVIEPTVFEDARGYFFESFNQSKFQELTGLAVNFVQDNQSGSQKGVLRGIHYQRGEHAQAKLVRVLKGTVLDIAVDLRKDSATFGQYFSLILSEENKKQLFVPRGFGHGFAVLSDTAEFSYKCDNLYNKASEGGIIYNDPTLDIDWMLAKDEVLLSEKDAELPTFENAKF
ncbi:dTDP-4-dehydrorhamnose 3,5-epimerase [Pustulibacterium marinum]|uniref:dTDP-4-dehydrorhamnose 3,5-epimerase n=1 Tax=Pustulibacterium marinum TaxID=1224947 RepID=A0A1I7ETM5_9FLAO|nr:dTDP-4-dehydrorhamnose 3,5-epimerase [Pustulibacterium marinum]SFU27270.1 dTDP-4-dehydrorhamnose 3,5-epimerase [Pustulibacterium marinum]